MVELGIDEFTLVLQVNPDFMGVYDDGDWPEIAKSILDDFADRTGLMACLGQAMPEEKKPAGYFEGYTFGEYPFYLCRFPCPCLGSLSAKAVDYIRSIGGIEPYELLQVGVNPSSYSARLARIDFTADFIDERFTVQEIYDGPNDGSLHVMREHLMFALGRLRSGKRRS